MNKEIKEQCKVQFVALSEQNGIKHDVNFDEVWEIGEKIQKRREFRDRVVKLEEEFINGIAMPDEEMAKLNPVKHSFGDGCYVREIFNPANELLITKIHKIEHPFFLMKGKMSILTDNGIEYLEAPHYGITKPGTKRVIYTHTDCMFVTVHVTDSTNIKDIEEEVIAKDFNDPAVTAEDVQLLKDSIMKRIPNKNNKL
tara:strand:+ start:197 stop:790 length:594 start_codon:yes stop_codon:yes gene_type:complete